MFKLKDSAKVKKGIIFAGCSFTWGQGLYYYSNLPTLQEPPPDSYDHTLLTRAHLDFKDAVRYPRLVAKHFETFEIVRHNNGGSNDGILDSIERWFDPRLIKQYTPDGLPTFNYQTEEVSHLVFQLTQWIRDFNILEMDGESIRFCFQDVTNDFKGEHGKFVKQYLEKNNLSLDELLERFLKNSLNKVKNCLKSFEDKGVKTILISWPNDYVKYIKNDEWLRERFLTIDYKEKTYNSMEEVMYKNRNLIINGDTNFFETCPKDHHPSLECHQVMAKNIIRFLEDRKSTTKNKFWGFF